MSSRRQRTISRPAEVRGFGLFAGADCRLRFLPAPAHYGIAFQRIDLDGSPRIPASADFVVPTPRRTVLSRGAATVEMVEHVMAALAGLWIDNCLVELDALEPPVGDGSSLEFVNALLGAGIVEQAPPVEIAGISLPARIGRPETPIEVAPADRLIVGYDLDYGLSALPRQSLSLTITPDSFVNEIAFARTFVLAREIEGLQQQGLGLRATPQNVLVFDATGPRDNVLRRPDECVRHKILDAIGDFALCGRRVQGRFRCFRSGHAQNREIAVMLKAATETSQRPRQAA